MAASTNGRADLIGLPIQLGDFLPERRQVILNGTPYTAWVVTNRRYPRSIMARLDRAARAYNRVVAPLLQSVPETENGQDEPKLTEDQVSARLKAADDQPESWEQYINECVMLLVPGILESEIDLIDLSVLEDLLVQLGYFNPKSTPREGPLVSNQSTGDTQPVDSVTSTQDTQTASN